VRLRRKKVKETSFEFCDKDIRGEENDDDVRRRSRVR
jgi:hypothetical protein